MSAAEKYNPEDLPVTAEEAAPLFGCSPRQVVDRLSKMPGFPKPTSRRPLAWVLRDVLAFRASLTSQPTRRR